MINNKIQFMVGSDGLIKTCQFSIVVKMLCPHCSISIIVEIKPSKYIGDKEYHCTTRHALKKIIISHLVISIAFEKIKAIVTRVRYGQMFGLDIIYIGLRI